MVGGGGGVLVGGGGRVVRGGVVVGRAVVGCVGWRCASALIEIRGVVFVFQCRHVWHFELPLLQ